MGCDIHLVVERKNDAGQWERVLPPVEARDPWLVTQAAEQPDSLWYKVRSERVWWGDRNYDLFGALANVRNGTWGEPVPPISEPRGLPDDLSDEVRRIAEGTDDEESVEYNDVGLGDHSHSWLLLSELLAYDWDRPQVFNAQATWTQPQRERQGAFFTRFLPALQRVGPPDRVRIVFGFDS